MSTKKLMPAAEATDRHHQKHIRLNHAVIAESDYEWLKNVECLTLWNVAVPDGFLAQLPQLWWLDLRGKSGSNLKMAEGCPKLRYLSVSQVRGMVDLGYVTELRSIEFLSLYGLSKVTQLPTFFLLKQLKRLHIGMVKQLESLEPALDAPNLNEIYLIKKVQVTSKDVDLINNHQSLQFFHWDAMDVPDKIWVPIVKKIKLPRTKMVHDDEWFDQSLNSSQ